MESRQGLEGGPLGLRPLRRTARILKGGLQTVARVAGSNGSRPRAPERTPRSWVDGAWPLRCHGEVLEQRPRRGERVDASALDGALHQVVDGAGAR